MAFPNVRQQCDDVLAAMFSAALRRCQPAVAAVASGVDLASQGERPKESVYMTLKTWLPMVCILHREGND